MLDRPTVSNSKTDVAIPAIVAGLTWSLLWIVTSTVVRGDPEWLLAIGLGATVTITWYVLAEYV